MWEFVVFVAGWAAGHVLDGAVAAQDGTGYPEHPFGGGGGGGVEPPGTGGGGGW